MSRDVPRRTEGGAGIAKLTGAKIKVVKNRVHTVDRHIRIFGSIPSCIEEPRAFDH